jgi:hypothetical protein
MSTISNIHTATIYDAKNSKPFTGQRLVKTIAKADKFGNYGQHLQQTMCTSIPVLTGNDLTVYMETNDKLDKHIIGFLFDKQSEMIAARIKSGIKTVTTEELDIGSIVAFLEAVGDSDKWDTARVTSWFNDNLAEHLGVKLLELGIEEDQMEKRLAKASVRFSESFGTKAAIGKTLAIELQKILNFAPDKQDPQTMKFQAKIDKALEEKSLEDALGF